MNEFNEERIELMAAKGEQDYFNVLVREFIADVLPQLDNVQRGEIETAIRVIEMEAAMNENQTKLPF